MKIILATNNQHKRRELEAILETHEVTTPRDLGIDFDHEETGATFLANAMGKAVALFKVLQKQQGASNLGVGQQAVVIADDSGLCVDALAGAPGIYSARYGSPDGGKTELDAAARNLLLLESLAGSNPRTAHFVCSMVALWTLDRFSVAQEVWNGAITAEPSAAKGGFGYDPVFFIPELGCTAAELSETDKNQYSHRGRAARVLAGSINAALDLTIPGKG